MAEKGGGAKAPPDLLKGIVKTIQKEYGEEAAIRLSENKTTTDVPYWISTGAMNFDAVLGGGIAGGRIIELFSRHESEGKTSCAAHISAECLKAGGYVLYADMEQTAHEGYFKLLGVDVEGDRFILSRPDTLEHLFEIIELFGEAVRKENEEAPLLIVVDSIAACQTKTQLEADYEDKQMAELARALSSGLRKLNPNISKMQITLLMLNQAREKIGVQWGDQYVTPGGNAMKYYASQRIVLRKVESIRVGVKPSKGSDTRPIAGIRIEANVKKNKVAAPFGVAEFEFYFGSGINYPASVFDFAVSRGVFLKESPGYFTHKVYGGKFRRADFITNFGSDASAQKIHDELRTLAMEPPAFVAREAEKEEDDGS